MLIILHKLQTSLRPAQAKCQPGFERLQGKCT